MTRGEGSQYKVLYKGLLVFVDDVAAYKKWKDGDTTIPLVDFVSTFKVFTTQAGAQGIFDAAAKSTLAAELDTEDTDKAIQEILQKGESQAGGMPGRQGPKNDSMGAMAAH